MFGSFIVGDEALLRRMWVHILHCTIGFRKKGFAGWGEGGFGRMGGVVRGEKVE